MHVGVPFVKLLALLIAAPTDGVPMPTRTAHTLSMAYVQRLLSGAARQGVSMVAVFEQAGLDPTLLEDPHSRLTGSELIRLIQTLMAQTEDEFIGLAAQRRSKPGTFSMMAHAVINCATLAQAIRRSAAFYELFETPVSLHFRQEPHEASLQFELREHIPDDDVIHELMVFVSLRFWRWLVGRRLDPLVIEFRAERPPHADEFQRVFRCPVVYDAEVNQIRFPAAWLGLPLAQTPLSLSRFLRDSVAEIIRGGDVPVSVTDQVRALLGRGQQAAFPDLPTIAERLAMSPQTLRRRLKDEGTSYQAIKDALREQMARFYLAKPALSVEEIALMMGFSEASAFHRAFKKWTGQTPLACRQQLHQESSS